MRYHARRRHRVRSSKPTLRELFMLLSSGLHWYDLSPLAQGRQKAGAAFWKTSNFIRYPQKRHTFWSAFHADREGSRPPIKKTSGLDLEKSLAKSFDTHRE